MKKPTERVTARSLAIDILDRLEQRDAWAELALDKALSQNPTLDQRDKALTTQLIYGVLRNRYRIDCFIEAGAKRPLKKLQPEIITLLRVGAYQLLYLDRIPASAAVNEAVTLAKTRGMQKASGLVNAVLRSISDGRAKLETPKEETQALALNHSLPPWLAERWIEEEGGAGATASSVNYRVTAKWGRGPSLRMGYGLRAAAIPASFQPCVTDAPWCRGRLRSWCRACWPPSRERGCSTSVARRG
jgi:16S rRNA (cytosine967-C5)-methyltransferase